MPDYKGIHIELIHCNHTISTEFTLITSPAAEALPDQSEIISKMRLVNDYWISTHSNPGNAQWDNAVYFKGNMDCYYVTSDIKYYNYALNWANMNNWDIGDENWWTPGSYPNYYCDNQFCGQAYFDLYNISPDLNKIAKITASLDMICNAAEVDQWWWCDALYLLSVYAEFSFLYNDSKYTNKMYLLYNDMKNSRKLFDPSVGLWYRDQYHMYPDYKTPNGKKSFWSRGNGWVFMGLARTLEYLPVNDPHRSEYISMFTTMAAVLKKVQRKDGFWNEDLNDTKWSEGPETSGTCCFAYGMAWGINNEILDKNTYLPVVSKAWNGLVSIAVQHDGFLGYVQDIGETATGSGPTVDMTKNFGVGFFLNAGREIVKLKKLVVVQTTTLKTTNVNPQEYIGKGNTINSIPIPNLLDIQYSDLNHDGKPDVMKGMIFGQYPAMWIDDTGNTMNIGDSTGDQANGCLCIDRNKDGIFGGWWDLCVKRTDEDADGKADIEFIYQNGNPAIISGYDWGSFYTVSRDLDKDGAFWYINWGLEPPTERDYEHDGACYFYPDYMGKTSFSQMCASPIRIGDFRYSWENPFLFYDYDDDGLTEVSIRMVDDPIFKNSVNANLFKDYSSDIYVLPSHKITWVAISYDMDNDNGPANEFDFDMSLLYQGPGFDYSDQVHKIHNTKRDTLADNLLFDSRWRRTTELIYADHDSAFNLIHNRGIWNKCWLTFDEDHDCKRWERVELYEPLDLFKIGMNKGGVDNHPQADAAGDRGEWDQDFSGKGKLYIGKFDGLLHLYGAEWGCWRTDEFAESYQGWGGLYEVTSYTRSQAIPSKYSTIKYIDTDNNGFFDEIQYDLDNDKIFERKVLLSDLGIEDSSELISIDTMNYEGIQEIFAQMIENNWENAQKALSVASHYNNLLNPETLRDKYRSGYWLGFHIYNDLRNSAVFKNDSVNTRKLDIAYFSTIWEL
jgi:rhamnogalacturonyl hydrolase YesR